jgi:hypothetical protein
MGTSQEYLWMSYLKLRTYQALNVGCIALSGCLISVQWQWVLRNGHLLSWHQYLMPVLAPSWRAE